MDSRGVDPVSAHTPGPWRRKLSANDYGMIAATDGSRMSGYRSVASVHGQDDEAEMEANARLIAAAPTMYEFIQRIERGDPFGIASPATAARALLANIDGAA